MSHRDHRYNLMGMSAILLTLTLGIPVEAAISEGPHVTNSVAAEEQRILMYHQAEQSFQEQIKVGKQRYEQKQVKRAKAVAAMTAELEARQQTIDIGPVSAPETNEDAPDTGSWLFPLMAALSVGFFGVIYRMNRRRAEAKLVRKPKSFSFPVPDAETEPVALGLSETTFFCKESGANGYGRPTKEGFMVLKGSVGCNSPSALRSKMLDSGVICEKGETVIFLKDQLFHTPTMAANALLGRNANGRLEWKTKDGMTLDAVQRQQPRTAGKRARGEQSLTSFYKPANSAAG